MPTLHWLNDEEARRAARSVPYHLLEEEPGLSYLTSNTESEPNGMLIQGDNLVALKSLLPYFSGKVKCIYIDPPFNTQQAFENYDDNLEHSIWLSTIYPRLELLHNLLSEDGVIYVHIDDTELGYLIALLDELFGRSNRITVITFKQGAATGHKAINPGLVTVINYIVVYAKDKSMWKPHRLFTSRGRDDRYSQYISNYTDNYQDWQTIPLSTAFSTSRGIPIKQLKRDLGKEKYEEELSAFVMENAFRVIWASPHLVDR